MNHRTRIAAVLTTLAGVVVAGGMTSAAASSAPPALPNTQVSATALTGYVIVDSAEMVDFADSQGGGYVNCPKTKQGVQTVPLSGGAYFVSTNLATNINSSFPDRGGTAWGADVINTSGVDADYYVYAICAKAPRGYVQRQTVSIDNPPNTQNRNFFACPSGDVVLGGGAYNTSGLTSVSLNGSWPRSTTSWEVSMNNASGRDASFTVYQICARVSASISRYRIEIGSSEDNAAGAEAFVSETCPSGLSILGGGLRSSSDSTLVSFSSSEPFTGGWSGAENNNSVTDASTTPYAICAT